MKPAAGGAVADVVVAPFRGFAEAVMLLKPVLNWANVPRTC